MAETFPKIDIEAHQKTYDGFVRLTTWSIIIAAVILILMAIFLV